MSDPSRKRRSSRRYSLMLNRPWSARGSMKCCTKAKCRSQRSDWRKYTRSSASMSITNFTVSVCATTCDSGRVASRAQSPLESMRGRKSMGWSSSPPDSGSVPSTVAMPGSVTPGSARGAVRRKQASVPMVATTDTSEPSNAHLDRDRTTPR
jgi:hypothetical protein